MREPISIESAHIYTPYTPNINNPYVIFFNKLGSNISVDPEFNDLETSIDFENVSSEHDEIAESSANEIRTSKFYVESSSGEDESSDRMEGGSKSSFIRYLFIYLLLFTLIVLIIVIIARIIRTKCVQTKNNITIHT